MTSYYEMLDIPVDAGSTEIETIIDQKYNDWRQYATHPDPNVVEEANRNLRLLEQIRTTLTDDSRRAVYDAGIGLHSTGGLTDPTAMCFATAINGLFSN